jgi:ankyrin repeat protein
MLFNENKHLKVARGEENETALYAASFQGRLGIVKLLLDRNADPNIKGERVCCLLRTNI